MCSAEPSTHPGRLDIIVHDTFKSLKVQLDDHLRSAEHDLRRHFIITQAEEKVNGANTIPGEIRQFDTTEATTSGHPSTSVTNHVSANTTFGETTVTTEERFALIQKKGSLTMALERLPTKQMCQSASDRSGAGLANQAIKQEEHREKEQRKSEVKDSISNLRSTLCADRRFWITTKSVRLRNFHMFVNKRRLPDSISSRLRSVVYHGYFSAFITICIVLNAMLVGFDTNGFMERSYRRYRLVNESSIAAVQIEDAPMWMGYIDLVFGIIFSIELVLRIFTEEWLFLFGEYWLWNFLDTVVVVASWLEIVTASFSDKNGTEGGLPPLRLIRVLRMLRSLRVIRTLRFLVQLRLVLLSLLHSFWPLLCCFFVLFLIMYVFAIFFMQVIGSQLEDHPAQVNPQDDWALALSPYFGTFYDAMVSLFGVLSGGEDWLRIHAALMQAAPVLAHTYVVYIVVMVLGVLNVIAAVFVEGALSKAKGDHQLTLSEQQMNEKKIAQELMREFELMDVSKSGCIDYNDWRMFLQSPNGQDFLKVFDMKMDQTDELFRLLDLDDQGEIRIDEFVVGFMQIYGSVSKLDVQGLIRNNKRLLRKCIQYIDHVALINEADSRRLSQRYGLIAKQLSSIHDTVKRLQSGAPPTEEENLVFSARSSERSHVSRVSFANFVEPISVEIENLKQLKSIELL